MQYIVHTTLHRHISLSKMPEAVWLEQGNPNQMHLGNFLSFLKPQTNGNEWQTFCNYNHCQRFKWLFVKSHIAHHGPLVPIFGLSQNKLGLLQKIPANKHIASEAQKLRNVFDWLIYTTIDDISSQSMSLLCSPCASAMTPGIMIRTSANVLMMVSVTCVREARVTLQQLTATTNASQRERDHEGRVSL